MYYETCHDYLQDQVKRPLVEALEKGDKETVLEVLDYCLQKFEETNAFAKGFEDYAIERGVKFDMPIMEYVSKYVAKYIHYNEEVEDDTTDNEC